MKIQEILPVCFSILVIILVAMIQRYSKTAAAVTATMPVTIPLALWIIYSSTQGNRQQIAQFSAGLVRGIVPTVAFVLAIWLGSRAGFKLLPLISVGYLAWGVTLGTMLLLRGLF